MCSNLFRFSEISMCCHFWLTHTDTHVKIAHRRNGETRHRSLVKRNRGRLFVSDKGLAHTHVM